MIKLRLLKKLFMLCIGKTFKSVRISEAKGYKILENMDFLEKAILERMPIGNDSANDVLKSAELLKKVLGDSVIDEGGTGNVR